MEHVRVLTVPVLSVPTGRPYGAIAAGSAIWLDDTLTCSTLQQITTLSFETGCGSVRTAKSSSRWQRSKRPVEPAGALTFRTVRPALGGPAASRTAFDGFGLSLCRADPSRPSSGHMALSAGIRIHELRAPVRRRAPFWRAFKNLVRCSNKRHCCF